MSIVNDWCGDERPCPHSSKTRRDCYVCLNDAVEAAIAELRSHSRAVPDIHASAAAMRDALQLCVAAINHLGAGYTADLYGAAHIKKSGCGCRDIYEGVKATHIPCRAHKAAQAALSGDAGRALVEELAAVKRELEAEQKRHENTRWHYQACSGQRADEEKRADAAERECDRWKADYEMMRKAASAFEADAKGVSIARQIINMLGAYRGIISPVMQGLLDQFAALAHAPDGASGATTGTGALTVCSLCNPEFGRWCSSHQPPRSVSLDTHTGEKK